MKRAPKPKAEPLPRVSEDVEAAIKAREERGLRSSSRVKDKLLGVTPTPAPSSVSFVSDGEEETEYYEGGRRVRTGSGGALFRHPFVWFCPEAELSLTRTYANSTEARRQPHMGSEALRRRPRRGVRDSVRVEDGCEYGRHPRAARSRNRYRQMGRQRHSLCQHLRLGR